jgi:hypothetical protein
MGRASELCGAASLESGDSIQYHRFASHVSRHERLAQMGAIRLQPLAYGADGFEPMVVHERRVAVD